MVFPIGDDNVNGGHKPIVAYILIGINILVFIYEMSLSNAELSNLFREFGAVPGIVLKGEQRYTLITNMFLHAGFMHILGNMLFLWVFGDNIEAIIGRLPFLAFYLVGGITASLIHSLVDPSSMIPAVGASGAISAVMGAYLVMFPKSRIKMIFIIYFKVFYISALLFLGFWIAQQIFSSMAPSSGGGSQVAWWAHIGGFLVGVLIGFAIKKLHPYTYSQAGYTAPDVIS